MRLLVDMNLSPFWVPFLTAQGYQAVHWSTVGAANAPDRETEKSEPGPDNQD